MKRWFKKNRRNLYLIIGFVLVSAVWVYAAQVPNTFQSGQPASASQVNDNFSYLADRSWELSGSDLYYNNGNVGIGTGSPGARLHLSNGGNNVEQLRLEMVGGDDTYQDITFYEGGGSQHDATIRVMQRSDGGEFQFLTGKNGTLTTKMTIQQNGNVGIGTTTPGAKLDVRADEPSNFAVDMRNISTTGGGVVIVGGSSTLPALTIFEHTATTQMFTVLGNGNVGIGTTTPNYPLEMGSGAHVTAGGVWTNASSREYKENIRDLTIGEAKITLEGLRPMRFNYKVDKEEEYLGFIAEDVPDLVASRDRKGISPMDIVALLTKVVQNQQKEIDELKARLNERQ